MSGPLTEPGRSATRMGTAPGFPRDFRIAGHWVNSYKVLLCIGIYVGVLVSAAVADSAGLSPLRMGMGSVACAIAGLAGARVYHLLVHLTVYWRAGSWRALWDSRSGGWSVFGALFPIVPLSFLLARVLEIPAAVFWDCLGAGIIAGGFWVRLGCVFNGCCCGRETRRWFGVRLHDVRLERKQRIPVQFLEMAWWLLGMAAFAWTWPMSFRSGSYALGVLGWYGFGRFWLEPLRETPDLVRGIRINQLVAAALALTAGLTLAVRNW